MGNPLVSFHNKIEFSFSSLFAKNGKELPCNRKRFHLIVLRTNDFLNLRTSDFKCGCRI